MCNPHNGGTFQQDSPGRRGPSPGRNPVVIWEKVFEVILSLEPKPGIPKFIRSFIHSLSKHLLSVYYMPGLVLGAVNIALSKKIPASHAPDVGFMVQ